MPDKAEPDKPECPECERLREALAEATRQSVKFDKSPRKGIDVYKESKRLEEAVHAARRAFLEHREQHRD